MEATSEDFLETLWQVVAAAMGLSVAMVAFAFEAFVSSGQRTHGGTLREFAGEARLVAAIRLGVLALLVDGAVLLGIGQSAPFGWSAVWATALSAFTLIAVLVVIGNVLRSLDADQMVVSRRKRLNQAVQLALRQQLLGQVADAILSSPRHQLRATRALFAGPGTTALVPQNAGWIHDVRIGPIDRATRKLGHGAKVELLMSLGSTVSPGTNIATVPNGASEKQKARIVRAVKVKSDAARSGQDRLLRQLARLHSQAMEAVRTGQEEDWREISQLYELVLLALPREADRLGIPFAGAVAAPGPIGMRGPMQRIVGYLLDELTAAMDAEDENLVEAIAYFPFHIALLAAQSHAISVAAEMIAMYPLMYARGLAHR